MPIKPWTIAIFAAAVMIGAPPQAIAQDLPTDQLDRHADVVRQDMLLRSTLRQSRARQNHRAGRPTPDQRAACAKRPQFRKDYGADHPKVQKLNGLCRSVGL